MAEQEGIELLVDPAVSRAKFARELAKFGAMAADRRRQGWWLLEASYPTVLVAFAAPQLRPASVVFGARLDFTNYDLWAPSVRIVNPFTGEPYKFKELHPSLWCYRRVVQQQQFIPGMAPVATQVDQPLLLAHSPDDIPFFCIPGVREYHEHPAHSGDSWLLHRGRGEGTLYFLLEKIYQYGVQPLGGYDLQMQIQIAGYARGASPP